MSQFISKSSLNTSMATFDEMLTAFGVVTVMNAKVFNRSLKDIMGVGDSGNLEVFKAHDILKALLDEVARHSQANPTYVGIDTLKIANINMEGPTKTVTGGQYVNPLIKFGKTATIEMQDALGRAEAIEALGGGIIETYENMMANGATKVLHLGQDFAGAKTILGESFFIDKAKGSQVKVYVLLYEMLPDSIFNLTQDAEGDATVFDLNGSLSAVDIRIGVEGSAGDGEDHTGGMVKGVFYSVLPQDLGYNTVKYEISFVAAGVNPAPDTTIALLNDQYGTEVVKGDSYEAPVITGLSFSPDSISNVIADQEIAVALAE